LVMVSQRSGGGQGYTACPIKQFALGCVRAWVMRPAMAATAADDWLQPLAWGLDQWHETFVLSESPKLLMWWCVCTLGLDFGFQPLAQLAHMTLGQAGVKVHPPHTVQPHDSVLHNRSRTYHIFLWLCVVLCTLQPLSWVPKPSFLPSGITPIGSLAVSVPV